MKMVAVKVRGNIIITTSNLAKTRGKVKNSLATPAAEPAKAMEVLVKVDKTDSDKMGLIRDRVE